MSLSFPRPCLINFDRSEDELLTSLGLQDILRDRIVAPPGEIKYQTAKQLLNQFEADVAQANLLNKNDGAVETLIIDGFSLFLDLVNIVTLEESENKNNTYRYAGRNAYIKNLFNTLNASGLNVVVISKAKPMWVNNAKVQGQYIPDTHDDVPFMVDVNLQATAEPLQPGIGLNFFGVIGMNAFNPRITNMRIANLDYTVLTGLLFAPPPAPPTEAK